jgi:ABC-type dipeptide/oligopeptide/nickel transport system permease subunit
MRADLEGAYRYHRVQPALTSVAPLGVPVPKATRAIAIILTVVGLNFIGDAMREGFDTRLHHWSA